jgi:hypothetical protein
MVNVELKQLLVEQSGMTGLVTDAENGDYSDKAGLMGNATHFINEGIKMLERRWQGHGAERIYRTTLGLGEYYIDIPYCQYLKRLDLSDGTDITRPEPIGYNEIRDRYPEPFSAVDAGLPKYWAWYPTPDASATSGIINGSFTQGLVGWTVYAGSPSVSSGVLTIGGNGNSNPNDALYQILSSTIDSSRDITIEIDSLDLGAFVSVTIGIWNTSPDDATVVETQNYLTAGTKTLSPVGDWNFISIGIAADQSQEAQISSVSVESASGFLPELSNNAKRILFMPPADKDYTVEIWGNFKNTPLVGDYDYNWWTVEHPQLVVMAAREVLEQNGFRNVSGREAFKQEIENELSLLISQHNFARVASLSTKEACRRG